MKKAISLFLALVVLVSVFAGLGITAYAVDTQALWVDPVNGSDSAAGTSVSGVVGCAGCPLPDD